MRAKRLAVKNKDVDVIIKAWLHKKYLDSGSIFMLNVQDLIGKPHHFICNAFNDGNDWLLEELLEVAHTFINSEYPDDTVGKFLAEKLGRTLYAIEIQWNHMTTDHNRHSSQTNDKIKEAMRYAK